MLTAPLISLPLDRTGIGDALRIARREAVEWYHTLWYASVTDAQLVAQSAIVDAIAVVVQMAMKGRTDNERESNDS